MHADAVKLLRKRCEVEICERPPSPEALATRAASASALLAFMPDRVDARLLDSCPQLRIAVARRIREGDTAVRDGEFAGWRPGLYGMGLEGTAVGIIGLGSLGQAIARRLLGFGCRLAYADPGVPEAKGLAARPLEELLRTSHVVMLATPLTPATHELISAERLA